MPATGIAFSFSWEIALMEWLQENLNGVAISILSFCSMFGEEILLILILGFLYWCYDKDLGRTTALTVLMGLTWGAMLKNIVLRRRPYFDHDEIRILRVVEPEADIYDISAQGYSFPSIHSANAMGLFVSFVLNTLLKLPFSEDFLESGTYSALIVRCARYMIIAFVDFGVYPLLFRKEKRTE